jgi:hypothetical protein
MATSAPDSKASASVAKKLKKVSKLPTSDESKAMSAQGDTVEARVPDGDGFKLGAEGGDVAGGDQGGKNVVQGKDDAAVEGVGDALP